MANDSEGSSPTAELAPWDAGELEGIAAIEPTPELVEQAYRAIMDKTLPPEIGDPAIVARNIQERIRRGTFDESLEPTASLPAWRELYLDEVVVVYGFHMNKSTIENERGELGVYAVVEVAKVGTGELVTVQTGGQNVLMQLVKAWEERRYPFQAVLIEVGTGTAGRRTQWLKRPEAATT